MNANHSFYSFFLFQVFILLYSQAQQGSSVLGCKIYSNEKSQCLNCHDGYKLSDSGDCSYNIEECHIRSSTNCHIQYCLKQSNEQFTEDHKHLCQECAYNFKLIRNECIYDNDNFQDINLSNMNSDCIVPNCFRCVESQNYICEECERGSFLKGNQCINNCGEGYGISNKNKCFKCQNGCSSCNQEGLCEQSNLVRQLQGSATCDKVKIDYQQLEYLYPQFLNSFTVVVEQNNPNYFDIFLFLLDKCFTPKLYPQLIDFTFEVEFPEYIKLTQRKPVLNDQGNPDRNCLLLALAKDLSIYYTYMICNYFDQRSVYENAQILQYPKPNQFANARMILNCNFDQICQRPLGCFPDSCLSFEVNQLDYNPSENVIILIPYSVIYSVENNWIYLQPGKDFEFDNSDSNIARIYFYNKIVLEGRLTINCFFKFPSNSQNKNYNDIFFTLNSIQLSVVKINIIEIGTEKEENTEQQSQQQQQQYQQKYLYSESNEHLDFLVIGISIGASILSGLAISYYQFLQNLKNNKIRYQSIVKSNESF